ncbi:FecCD family ABC transporter permease [Saccharopolyspora flava]|uniref:Iron complex transport system permease protein n=1 Tax=Saccharopolyspora flava TaxID=95161 RepID=A0A1I6T0A1_9PSEU|nr:iron chelate uptake ABC transporter family permease subunit [Saccharopolyspora flava]SFS82596.1 iron complex transport system permease protein [Saccharopolyspora flava]
MRTGRLRAPLLVLAGIPALLLSIAVAVTLGPAPLSVGDVAGVVGARLGLGETDVSRIGQGIVWQLRLPRAVLAAICGAGLGTCGAVLQSLLRNPLADPFLLGVSAGASTGAVLVVILGLGAGAIGLTAGAFAGALVAFALVMTLGSLAGGTTTHLVLAGVAGTQLFSALTSFVVITSADAEQTRGVLFWLLGSLSGARWNDVAVSGVVCAVCLLVCLARAGSLDAFALGRDTAAALGVNVARLRIVLLVVTALLAATLVAAAGAIGFVGLVLPQAAKLVVGPRHRALLPVTAVLGAILLVWVDVLATTVAAPQEVPVGVMTALVGVPAFAILLARRGRTS